MTQQAHIFDRQRLRICRERSKNHFSDYDFLHQWAGRNLQERLNDITRDFKRTIQLGVRGPKLHDNAHTLDYCQNLKPNIIADPEFLPLKTQSLDLIISNLEMHSINDLPGSLLQIRKALQADGLFMASIFGGETLYELRASLNAAEISLKGGISPRVFPFADKQQMGALLQRAGFALPVVDSDIITVTYDNMFKLMADLRGMGESNIISARDKRYVGKSFFMDAAQHYAENYSEGDGRIVASFEVIFLLGWAPHESQQKPLKPGSADTHLSDILR